MKFKTNFAEASINWVKLLTSLFLLISVLLMLYIAVAYYQSLERQVILKQLNKQQTKLQQHIQQQQLQVHQFISDDQLQQLRQDIQKINAVTDINSLDVSTVFYVIELALPKHVTLEQFTYDSSQAESSLTAQSTEPDLLNAFIESLQQDPRFNQIDLIDQKQVSSGQSVVFRYQLKIRHKNNK